MVLHKPQSEEHGPSPCAECCVECGGSGGYSLGPGDWNRCDDCQGSGNKGGPRPLQVLSFLLDDSPPIKADGGGR